MLNKILSLSITSLPFPSNRRKGSALLLTLMVVSLLLVISLSFTVFVRLELRTVQARVDREIARKNAMLGLQLALGELQMHAGPDQRVTANAEILDQSLSVPHPKWLGVWNSWTTWLNDGIDSTYTPGRASQFRRWLISYDPDPSSTVLENLSQPSTIPNPVELLGTGTLGAGADPSLMISATKIPVNADRGSYAWWVGGENQKAFVDAVTESTSTLEDLHARSQWPSSAPEGMAGLDALAVPTSEWARIHDFDSMALPMGAQGVREQLKARFHDLTVQSKGVLANVRNGGLKKDLNLLLENDTLPEEYGTEDFLDNDHQGTIKSIRPLTADIPLPSGPHSDTFSEYPPSHETPIYKKPNFTSWYKLHQYYSLYKNSTGPLGQERLQGSNVPEIESFWGNNRLDAGTNPNLKSYLGFGYDLAPVVARVTTVFSVAPPEQIQPGKWEYKLYLHPIVTLWNPYNVTLKVPGVSLTNPPNKLVMKVYIDGSPAPGFSEWRLVHMAATPREAGASLLFLYDGGDQEIVLRPGETRIFSPTSSRPPAGSNIYLDRGYEPPATSNGGILVPIADWYDGDGYPYQLVIDAPTAADLPTVSLTMKIADNYIRQGDGRQDTWAQTIGGFRNRFSVDGRPQDYAEVVGDWIPPGSDYSIFIIPDRAGDRMSFPSAGSSPIPFAAVSTVLKNGQKESQDYRLENASGTAHPYVDYRCKSFIHADPANQRINQGAASDRAKAMGQYMLMVEDGSGGATSIDVNGQDQSFIGSAISLGEGDYAGQPRLTTHEIPVAPITSLASLMHFKLSPGLTGFDWNQIGSRLFDISPNQALAIGNSFAHPLLPVDELYRDLPDFDRTFGNGSYSRYIYDKAYFNNDALWDAWYCSGITRQETGLGYLDQNVDIDQVLDDFLTNTRSLANPHLQLWQGDKTPIEIKNLLVNGSAPALGSWDRSAEHLMLQGAFNINSTSVSAWKALLWGLRNEELDTVDPNSGAISTQNLPDDRVVLSRFSLPASAEEGDDAGDPDAWVGIRLLTESQIDKLAEECVRQVKLRGPFLNMADFINRRLEDSDLGQVGTLQAAIDWDEWNGNSPSAAASDSINGRFKHSADLIYLSDVNFDFNANLPEGNPDFLNPRAGTGSRWTGIPGYVTQADLLKRIGNQISPRDDTFKIRAYGESKNAAGGVLSRSWCEAVVQRIPEYVEEEYDEANIPQNELVSLINRSFGRKFRIVSFRWLNPDEV